MFSTPVMLPHTQVDEGAVYESSSPGSPAYSSFSGVLMVPEGHTNGGQSSPGVVPPPKWPQPSTPPTSHPRDLPRYPFVTRPPPTPSYLPTYPARQPLVPQPSPPSTILPFATNRDHVNQRPIVGSGISDINKTSSLFIPLISSTHNSHPPFVVSLHPLQDQNLKTFTDQRNIFFTQTKTALDTSGYAPSHGKRPVFTRFNYPQTITQTFKAEVPSRTKVQGEEPMDVSHSLSCIDGVKLEGDSKALGTPCSVTKNDGGPTSKDSRTDFQLPSIYGAPIPEGIIA